MWEGVWGEWGCGWEGREIIQSINLPTDLLSSSVEISCWDHLLRSAVKIWFVAILCWDLLLRSSVEINCWDYLLSSSVGISCWDHLLRSAVKMWFVAIISWDLLLKSFVDITCWYYLLISSVEIRCWDHLQKINANNNNYKRKTKNIKKPMSIPSKARKIQKTHEHSIKSEPGMQKHQKTHEHTIKNKKRSKNPWA